MMVVGWVYGIMGFTGYQINAQTVTIGALSLGLGVDYAVHFSVRLEEEVERNPLASQEMWVTNASATTGRAMFAAALTTAGGFSVLNLSALLPLRLFGQAFVVAITLALLSSLILLPAFYTPFLKHDAEKFALTHKEAE
jgi:predicted RND superfamily exporter protein